MQIRTSFLKMAFVSTLVLMFLFMTNISAYSQEGEGGLYAGIAKINITPEKPVKLSGYGGRADELSKGVWDSLYARAVVFEKNSKRLVFVLTDVISPLVYFREDILNEFELEPSELFLSAIHTHSGPSLGLDEDKEHPNNVEYTKSLKPKLIKVIRKALNNMKDIEIGACVGYSPVGINRRALHVDGHGYPIWSEFLVKLGRNPYGNTDKEVLVMKVADSENKDKPTAVLIDYACHGTCLSDINFLLSGDVLGIAEQFVEKIIGKGVIAPVFAGASGNINPYMRIATDFSPESGWIPEHILQGTMLGEEIVRVYLNIEEKFTTDEIKTDFATITLPGKEGRTLRNEGTEELTRELNITAACIGDIGFIGFGGEITSEIGMTIKEASPFKYTFVITHCNGKSGYLVPKDMYREGGYEVETSKFAPGAAEMAVKKVLDMLYKF